MDRPALVQALVMVASACRLGPLAKQVTQDLARFTRNGDFAAGWAKIGLEDSVPAPLRGPALPLFRLLARPMAPDDPTDMLVTLDAEDAFDVGQRLHQVTAPTLVIGGAKDPFYPRGLFEQTAAGVQDGRAHIYPKWGHERTRRPSTTAHITLGFLLAARHT